MKKISEQTEEERSRNRLQAMFVALLILTALLALFTFRSLDDNRLISWLWVFSGFSVVTFIFIVSIAIMIAYALSRISFSEKTSITFIFITSYMVATYFWRIPEVIIDASRYFMQAKQLELHGIGYFVKEWGNEIPAWTDLPLIPFLYGVILSVFGENRVYLQAFNSLLFSGTVLLTYLIGKKLWDKQIGLYAAALMFGMPYLIVQVPLTMVDIGTMFFLTLAIFTTINAIESGRTTDCLFASIAISLAMLCKYSNWLMLSVIPIITFVFLPHDWKTTVRRTVFIAISASLLMAIFLLAKYDLVSAQLQLLQDFQAPALLRWQESWVSTFLFQIHPLLTLSILFSVVVAIKNRDAKYLIISWLVMLLFVLEIKRIRYLIAIMPMLAIMAAYGISLLTNIATKKFIVSGIAVSTVLLTASTTLPFLEKTSANNLKLAGEYLNSINAENIAVYVLPGTKSSINPLIAIPILDIFTTNSIDYPDTNSQKMPKNLTQLPWRWTWELNPVQYLSVVPKSRNNHRTVVVIHSEDNQPLPDHVADKIRDYHLRKDFNVSASVFRYKTYVRVYQRNVNDMGEDPN